MEDNSNSNSNAKEMQDETIQTYLRLKPSITGNNKHITIYEDRNLIEIKVPKANQGYVNNTIEKHLFQFDKIFNAKTNQEELFTNVAQEVIDSTLDGFNGTIFAYGQTGSGKTYSITGGVESIELRGIIPRALSYIFEQIKKRAMHKWKVYISYLEIYNNDGYDLIHESTGKKNFELENLPKVRIRENENRQYVLTNLSIHQVENFQEGMTLLMLGDENRVVAETPKNDASTRSHCIFMIQIESEKMGEDVKTLSKLHIVDLSGSEKPYKADLNGIRMEEALSINLSLHFLEQVIVSINMKEKHIPYRNSMMTMCLRDSIGGNCKTRMVATMSSDFIDVLESLSTCRFAQRVALIKNSAIKNEVLDPSVIIQKQKAEIEDLKSELAMVKGKNQKSVLDDNDITECQKIVTEFLADETFTKKIELNDMLMIQECFAIVKVKYKDLERKVRNISSISGNEIVMNGAQNFDRIIELENVNKKLTAEIEKLREIISRRDEETKVLLNAIEKNKTIQQQPTKKLITRIEEEDARLNEVRNSILGNIVKFEAASTLANQKNESTLDANLNLNLNLSTKRDSQTEQPRVPVTLLKDINTANSYLVHSEELEKYIDSELISNRNKAYEFFKNNYYKRDIEEENKNLIKEKMENGKKLSIEYSEIKDKVTEIKRKIEDVKKRIIIENIKDPTSDLKLQEASLHSEYLKLKAIEDPRRETLKKLYEEINTMKTIIKAYEETRIKNYEFWIDTMKKKTEHESKYGKIQMNSTMLNLSAVTNNDNVNITKNSNSDLGEISQRLQKTREKLLSDIQRK